MLLTGGFEKADKVFGEPIFSILGIPAKLNAYSEGKPNGIPG